MAGSDGAVWRSVRGDFEGLPSTEWSLIWSSRPPVWIAAPVQLPSQWTWFHPTDKGLRTRASAIFLKAANARGYGSEDEWLDEVRYADFVRFQLSASSTDKLPDGTFVESEAGILKDAVVHSITLCHQLEAGCAPKPVVGILPKDAMARMDAVTVSFFRAEFMPKLEREATTGGPIWHAELLRELVLHQFNLVARECMVIYPSVDEFEAELRAGIARFVKFNVSQYGWLSDSMRQELNLGFTFFVMSANPWAGILETERASRWHIGAITGEALSDAALKLIAEATTRAANKQPPSSLATVKNSAVSTPSFPNRASWLKERLLERGWGNADPSQFGGPDRKTIEKMLRGENVRNDVLDKLAAALSKKFSTVTALGIPKD